MSAIQFLNQASLLSWLKSLGFEHYMCGQCDGIHISAVQMQDGVIESRLFLDHDRLIYTTELDIRHSTLFAASAELHRLNAIYANIKLFLDVADTSPARLVVCDTQWMTAGLSKEQFDVFLRSAIESKLELLELLSNLHFLDILSEEEVEISSDVIH